MSNESLSFKIECQGSRTVAENGKEINTSTEANEFWQNIPVPEELLKNQEEPEAK